jgi:hypothetical protein
MKGLLFRPLGEYYDDLLCVDSWINDQTKVQHGKSLLCLKLQEQEPTIKEHVKYLAKKRGISFDEMWFAIVSNKAQRINPNELEEILKYKSSEEVRNKGRSGSTS